MSAVIVLTYTLMTFNHYNGTWRATMLLQPTDARSGGIPELRIGLAGLRMECFGVCVFVSGLC